MTKRQAAMLAKQTRQANNKTVPELKLVPALFKIKYSWHHFRHSNLLYIKLDLYATIGPISYDLIRTGQIN